MHTRYDGADHRDERIVELVRRGKAVPVCPEQLGGLPTPRPKAEINGGDGEDLLSGRAEICSEDGVKLDEFFLKGAYEVLRLAEMLGAEEAIMKDGSPSCGLKHIKRGGKNVRGMGVTTALLIREGVKVKSSDSI